MNENTDRAQEMLHEIDQVGTRYLHTLDNETLLKIKYVFDKNSEFIANYLEKRKFVAIWRD